MRKIFEFPKSWQRIISILLIIVLFNNCQSSQVSVPLEENPSDVESAQSPVSQQCLSTPPSECSAEKPCNNGTTSFSSASDVPSCYADGSAKIFTDRFGTHRYFCHFRATQNTSKKPLIIWLHGGSGSADNLYTTTQLRNKADVYQFHLVSLQSRNLHIDLARLKDGRHFDTWWWDFNPLSENRDISALDSLIDMLVKTGDVDPLRIYLIGWSEGGMLAQLYGMARHSTASAYGHKVAAVSVYSASSPFHRLYENLRECSPQLRFQSNLPIYTISRSCDVIACNRDQEESLWQSGSFADVINMPAWIDTLQNDIKNPYVSYDLINRFGSLTNACDGTCTLNEATINHLTWPVQYEDRILSFLMSHTSK